MPKITIERCGATALVRLSNGPTNAISPEMVAALAAALPRIKAEFGAMVLTGGSKFFSIGLDLPLLLTYDRADMSAFWKDFDRLILDLYTLPLPTATAISGHATAGGTILALTTDYRYGLPGRKLLGLNEIKIGVPVPMLADLLLRQIVSDRAATEMTYHGEFRTAEQARDIGLVDQVVAAEQLETQACESVAAMAARLPLAFRAIKTNRVSAICHEYQRRCRESLELFLDCWFNPQVQALLQRTAQDF